MGIDPGTNIMGYGVLKITGTKPTVMTLGVIDLRRCGDPYLKLKPISKIESNGYCQLGVETYGGGIWESWLDRDLGLAGRVMVRVCCVLPM